MVFSRVAAPVCIPTNSALGFPFLHSLTSTCLLIGYGGHSHWCGVVSHCGFNLLLSNGQHPFMCLWALCMSCLENYLFRSLAHFLIRFFVFFKQSLENYLYIFEINPLSEVSFVNTFSHVVGSLFILLIFSQAVQNFFILIKSHLFILSLPSFALGEMQVKILLYGYLRFSCLFSSRTFNVLPLLILFPGTRRLVNLISLGAITKHKVPEMELRGHTAALFLLFYLTPYCSLPWLHQSASSPIVHEISLFSIPKNTNGVRKQYKQLYAKKLDNQDKIDKFLETHNLGRLNQEESENLNRQVTPREIEAVTKNSQQTKVLDQMASQVNFTKHSKDTYFEQLL